MRFAFAQKISTFALAGIAAFPLLGSGEISRFWVVALPVLGAIGWMLEPPLTRLKKYRRAMTLVAFLFFIVQAIRFSSGTHPVEVGIEFTMLLLGIKLCCRGVASDYSQIVILSFLHIIAATVAVDDLSYAASFLMFVALCPPVLALAYLRREMEQRFTDKAHPMGPGTLERLLRSRRLVSPTFIAGSSLLSLPILVLTAVLFIIFPRMGFGLFGRLPHRHATVGFGPSVTIGDIDLIRNNETVLMRLKPFGFSERLPKHWPLKIRGAIFDTYEDNTWKLSKSPLWRQLSNQGKGVTLDKAKAIHAKTHGFEILLESIEPPLVFTPEGTGHIWTFSTPTRNGPAPRALEESQYGTIRYSDTSKVGIRYRIFLTGTAPYGPPPSDELQYLQLPQKNARLVALAQKIAGEGPQAIQTNRLIHGLKTTYRYATQFDAENLHTQPGTPLDRFLFTRRTGTCEHFATALTLLLRGVGIQARLVTGFSSIDWNGIGSYYAVRSESAHAWTEVFLDGQWVTVDATPASAEAIDPWAPSTLVLLLDTLRMRWHKYVVSYDASSQFELAMDLWQRLRRQRTPGTLRIGMPVWPFLTALGLAGFAAMFYWIKRRKKQGMPTSKTEKQIQKNQNEVRALYRKLEQHLAALGFPRPSAVTPIEHANGLALNGIPIAHEVIHITTRYNSIRFGGRPFDPKAIETLRRQIQRIT
ncbi:MAG: DUF3488 and transglutaminase-like domain-containing protein [Myxococcota bacterium]|nr:DUF3488 and transglutaminase-like domain-containing protein [Myxococcota bacterium]